METWKAFPAVLGRDFVLSLGDALASWKVRHALRELLLGAAVGALIRDAARQAGISVSADELQGAADGFRTARGLHSAEQTRAWMQGLGLSLADFEAAVEERLLVVKLTARIPAESVRAAFEARREGFARARLRRLTVASEGAARELLARLTEEGEDFAELALAYSLDSATRAAGGDLGVLARRDLPPEVAAPIFAAAANQIVGPLTTASGVHLFRVEELLPAELNPAVERLLRGQLFEDWLRNTVQARQLTFPLLQPQEAPRS